MVRKILNFIGQEVVGLHQAAYLLGSFAILSQVLGLIRDRLLAATFGAGEALDIYYAAFRIPDFIFITVGSMVSVSVLIPFLMNKMKDGEETGRRFIGNIFLFFFLLIVAISAIAFFLMPGLNPLLFPGFDNQKVEQVTILSRVLLLSPIFLGLSNILGTLTQTHKRFFLYALSPILYNVSIIGGILLLYPDFGLVGLVYGVILGAFFHFAIQIPFIIEHGLLPNYKDLKFDFKEIKKVLLVSIPRTLTLGSDNISFIFLVSFASLMTTGSIAVFNFSYNLETVPLAIIGISYSLAVFPILIKHFSDGNIGKFREETILSAKHIIFWSIPFATLFIVLRAQIVRTILGAGQFSWYDTRLTAAALAIFAISIVFQNLTLLFVRAYYATGNTRKPFLAKFLNALTTIVLGYVFMTIYSQEPMFRETLEWLLKVEGVPGAIILTLPLGWSIGELLNTILLWGIFERDFKSFSGPVIKTFWEVLAGSLVIGIVTYFGLNIFDKIFNLETSIGIFMQGFISGAIGIIAGIFILTLLRNKELEGVLVTLKNKMSKVKVIPPSPSGLSQ
ncbi:MAG: murein biosynthesis integral membrane protein MurJ [Candidatus Vogelbacteria bacterium]|nr:murein biosynthesis integral membrane protein MurJ [Candidatus Vogelbacteria bacterium]